MNIKKGNPLQKGSTKQKDGYNFAIASAAEIIDLLLYAPKADEPEYRIELTEAYKTGDVFSVHISGIYLDRYLYCYEADGKKIIDPYAKTITGCEVFGKDENKQHLSRVCLSKYDWEDDTAPEIPYHDSVFYKCSVRGLTASKTSKVRHKGTFSGVVEKLPYLKELGITAVLFMPLYEFDEIGKFPQLYDNGYGKYASGPIAGRINYWGYTKGFYFAPKASFAWTGRKKADYTAEMKDMVKAFHKEGMEVLMEMHFQDEPVDFILDCLHYWVTEYHIDGIHLFAGEAALNAAARDALLAKTKLITVFWNGEKKQYKNMANYNAGFMNVARKFLKGDENQLGDFVNVSRYNPVQSANINYITSHDGFTLFDLVSYDRKHNEANGEGNADGENFNNSWNCGTEGPSKKKKIQHLRLRQMKNALMLVLLSQGTPLLLAGDECCNSQAGNNNPYCVDSELSWVSWNSRGMAAEMTAFVKQLIAFRKQYKILHMPKQLLSYDSLSCGYPDISCHGSSAWYNTMESYNRHIGMMYYGRYAYIEDLCQQGNADADTFLYIAYNMHWEEHELALPIGYNECDWQVALCSGDKGSAVLGKDGKTVHVKPRCIAVLTGLRKKKENNKKTNRKTGEENGHS